MREILFRAKKAIITEENERYLDNGFVYGETIMTLDDGTYIQPYGVSAECYYERPYNFRANSDCFMVMFAEVIPETVGQFTGLYDKNGKRIFEGDILKIETHIHNYLSYFGNNIRLDEAVVLFNGKSGGYKLKVYNGGKYKRIAIFDTSHISVYKAEVIGNIYDNPELIKENEDER